MDYEKIITWGLAIYGAVLSTILGVRELINERRRIIIFLQYWEFHNNYSILITNVGHRPITLLGISMDFLPQEYVPMNVIVPRAENPFPVTLTDGQHLTITLSQGLSSEIYDIKENIKITVYDSENRKYSKFKRLSFNEKAGIHSSRKK